MGCSCSKVTRVENGAGLLHEPPDHPQSKLTAAWLAGELAKEGVNVQLDDVAIEQLSAPNIDGASRADGGGISGSRIVRLRLQYAAGSPKLPGDAETLVMKWTSFPHVPNLSFNLRIAQVLLFKVNHADLFRTEHYFLGKVKDVHSWGVQTPKTYVTASQQASEPPGFARLLWDARSKLITSCIMEDIGAYKTPAVPFGNVTYAKAAGAMRNVAKLHRFTWGRQGQWAPDLHEIHGRNGMATSHIGLYGLEGSGIYERKKTFAKSSGPPNMAKVWGKGNKKAGDDKGLLAIKSVAEDPNLLAAFRDLQQNWSLLFPKLGVVEPQCMVHGDFHHWNNMYGKSDDDVMLVDWQYFGSGRVAYELGYFFCAGYDCIDDDEKLLREYHDTLTSAPPDQESPAAVHLPFEQLLLEYRLAIIDMAVTMCISLGTRTFGVQYRPSDFKRMAVDPKQRDFVVGGMLLSERMFKRLIHLHRTLGSFSKLFV
ncbi:hypothetical protein DIPPA_34139 [Diplonema papillatum]|nr:hypothetical protein DIPPA_34139 [Diplonema papillatum]KAJ9466810.1 hypothetical protein DIPPA_34139 [Diplonema papillatum]